MVAVSWAEPDAVAGQPIPLNVTLSEKESVLPDIVPLTVPVAVGPVVGTAVIFPLTVGPLWARTIVIVPPPDESAPVPFQVPAALTVVGAVGFDGTVESDPPQAAVPTRSAAARSLFKGCSFLHPKLEYLIFGYLGACLSNETCVNSLVGRISYRKC